MRFLNPSILTNPVFLHIHQCLYKYYKAFYKTSLIKNLKIYYQFDGKQFVGDPYSDLYVHFHYTVCIKRTQKMIVGVLSYLKFAYNLYLTYTYLIEV